jgi:hypothetical protein
MTVVQNSRQFRSFGIENWNLFGIWNLSFGVCDQKPSLVPVTPGQVG